MKKKEIINVMKNINEIKAQEEVYVSVIDNLNNYMCKDIKLNTNLSLDVSNNASPKLVINDKKYETSKILDISASKRKILKEECNDDVFTNISMLNLSLSKKNLENIERFSKINLEDFKENILYTKILESGKEGYYIEICHYNYNRMFCYINDGGGVLPTKIYNCFKENLEDKIMHVALLKVKEGKISISRKKQFKLPAYHFKSAADIIRDVLKSIDNFNKYVEGINVEIRLEEKLKVYYEHRIENGFVLSERDSFNTIVEYQAILANRRNIKEISQLIECLKYRSDLNRILSINVNKINEELDLYVNRYNDKIKGLEKEWSNFNDKLIVVSLDNLTEDGYKEIVREFSQSFINPYSRELVAYNNLYG